MPSRKKLNTYGVESPCGCSPEVGSFLANPGLSKEQLVPSCTMMVFILRNSSIRIMAQYQRSCEMKQFWAWRDWWWKVKWFKAIHRVICHILRVKMTQITPWNDADCMTTHITLAHHLHKILRFIDLYPIYRRLWKVRMEGLSNKKGDWDADVIRLCISFIVNVVCRLVSHDYRPMG